MFHTFIYSIIFHLRHEFLSRGGSIVSSRIKSALAVLLIPLTGVVFFFFFSEIAANVPEMIYSSQGQ